MKKLLFILFTLFVAFGAYCQTKYPLPYDTVITMKPNGVGYLKAAKGNFADSLWHRITLGLRDSSALVATTKWVKQQNYGSGGGGGNPNSNVGSGYRWAIPGTNNIKTYLAGYGNIFDSLTSNSIKSTIDTTLISTKANVNHVADSLAAAFPSSLFPLTGTGTATGDVTGNIGTHSLLITGTSGSYFLALNDGTNQSTQNISGGITELSSIANDNSSGATLDLFASSGAIMTLLGTSSFTGGATDSVNYAGESYVQKDWVINHIANGVASLNFSQSVTKSGNTVTLVNDANTDSTYYGNLGGKGWLNAAVITTGGGLVGQVPVYQGGKLFALQSITTTAPGNNRNLVINNNGSFGAPASDSMSATANGLDIKGKYLVNGGTVVYRPDQTNFLNDIFYGSLPASLTHTSGVTGQYNTSVGLLALNALSSGSANVAVGSRAGQAVNSGTNNTMVGEGAGIGISTGTHHTAIGNAALSSMTGSTAATAVGSRALQSATGNYNTALGDEVYFNTTSGTENTGLGVQTGFYNITGINNTLMGSQSGVGTPSNSFSNNTAAGYKSLFAVSTGSNNIAIGAQAAVSLTSGANNIAICYNCDLPSNTASSQLTIGNLIFATGGFGTGTSIGAGNVGIKVASPSYSLDVSGSINVAGTTGNVFRWNAANGTPTNTVTPVGWVRINVNGTDSWLPYYQ